jgi:glycosyltransferase involved in cell wall biosynthesis
LQLLDEVWVPSEFCREAVAAKADIPVVCMPHSITTESPTTSASRKDFELPENSTVFLTMYDALSVPERKNPEAAINAFLTALESGDIDAHLAIKVSNLDRTPDHGSALRKLAEASGHITLIEGYLNRSTVFGLIQSCDAFLSLHRSEGFGLGLAEAMLLGKVAIATDWSGNRQFMNADNSLLIASELVQLARNYGPYEAGQYWAEPSAEQAVEAILRSCQEPELRRTLGERARDTIASEFSEAAVGARILDRLQTIAEETEGLSKAG